MLLEMPVSILLTIVSTFLYPRVIADNFLPVGWVPDAVGNTGQWADS